LLCRNALEYNPDRYAYGHDKNYMWRQFKWKKVFYSNMFLSYKLFLFCWHSACVCTMAGASVSKSRQTWHDIYLTVVHVESCTKLEMHN
jgi:hypothetical protein